MVQKEDPAVRAKMNACQELIDKLEGYHSNMNSAKDKAFTDIGKIAPVVESEEYELSGDYYDKYVEYRKTWKEVFTTNYSNALDTITSLGERIEELEAILAELSTHLLIWVEEEYDDGQGG